jgi:hypothetical protein
VVAVVAVVAEVAVVGVADALKGCAIVEGVGHAVADFLGNPEVPHAL